MSRTRFDRKPRPEEWKSDYFVLSGGLDQRASALNVRPGRLIQCLNFEEVFGKQGYQFCKGYERYDGRARPSQADYAVQPFDTGGVTPIAAGNTVTSAGGATALVVSVTLTSGSWAGSNAAGSLLLTTISGTWADNDAIKVGGVTRALASDATTLGSVGYSGHQTALTAVRTYLRALILQPTGEGEILGGAVFNELVYCVRNVVGSATATMWKSSAAGWVSVKTGLHPSTPYKFVAENFSGDPTTLNLYGVSGKGRLFSLTQAGVFTYAAPIFGSEGTSTSAVLIGTGAKTFAIIEGTRSWVAGQALTIYDTATAGNSMVGTVTSYNSGTNTLVMNITSVTGSGTISSWEIGLTDLSDKPFLVREHKDHLFLAFPGGQLQTSDIGEPMTYTTTSMTWGLGAEITGLSPMRGEVLAVLCQKQIRILRGSSSLDWDLGRNTSTSGARAETTQDNNGNPLFLDDAGLRSLQATQAFGDFEPGIFSADVKATLDARRDTTVGSRMATGNYQYRLYFDDGTNLRFTFLTGAGTIMPKDVSACTAKYDHVPSCFFSGTMEDGNERMFFGTSDGYVMEEDSGTSFDGAEIFYGIRLPFNHLKTPSADKQMHMLEFELVCPDALTLNYRLLFDYEDGTFAHGSGSVEVLAAGGQFDVDDFDTFSFDMQNVQRVQTEIDGQGRNMGMLVWAESDFVRPASLQGILTFFSMLGIKR